MFIVNKDGNDMYNTEHIVNIYQCDCTIKVCAGVSKPGGILGRYNNYEDTQLAYDMLIGALRRESGVFIMPGDEELRKTEIYHHPTGKKTKGHGGS